MAEIENAGAGQRVLADYQARVQHGTRRIHGLVPAGATDRFHQGDCQRLAGIPRRPPPRLVLSIIIRMSAIRKLAAEAADNGLLAPELAAGISRVKSAKTQGIRVGNWLSLRQAQALLSEPDITTIRGLRDRAVLAVLLGCGLRRSEVAALTFSHLQQRDGRWCIVDLVGKHGRVRTAPMPTWVKVAIDAWVSPACVTDGHVFRSVNRGDRVTGESLGEKVVWQLIKPYAEAAGVPGIAPHDLRRTCAKLCRAGGGELEQIQLLLGHASVQTTERYLGTKQDLVHAPNDAIKLRVAV